MIYLSTLSFDLSVGDGAVDLAELAAAVAAVLSASSDSSASTRRRLVSIDSSDIQLEQNGASVSVTVSVPSASATEIAEVSALINSGSFPADVTAEYSGALLSKLQTLAATAAADAAAAVAADAKAVAPDVLDQASNGGYTGAEITALSDVLAPLDAADPTSTSATALCALAQNVADAAITAVQSMESSVALTLLLQRAEHASEAAEAATALAVAAGSGSAEGIMTAAQSSLAAITASYDTSSFPRVLGTISYTADAERRRRLASVEMDAVAAAAAGFVIDEVSAYSIWVKPGADAFQALDDHAGQLKVYLLLACYVNDEDVGAAFQEAGFLSAVQAATPGYTLGAVSVSVDSTIGSSTLCHTDGAIASLHEEIAQLQALLATVDTMEPIANLMLAAPEIDIASELAIDVVAVPIPAPPSPPVYSVEVALTMSGSVSDYSDEDIAAFTASMDEKVGVSGGSTTITAASVLFTYTNDGLSAEEKEAAAEALAPILASPEAASAYLASYGDFPVETIVKALLPPSSPPVPPTAVPTIASPPPPGELDDGDGSAITGEDIDEGATAGITVAVVAVTLPLMLILYVLVRYGPTKIGVWCKYHTSHSDARYRFGYVPREQRKEMKEKLYSKTDIMNPKLTEAMSSEDSLEFGRTRSELGTTIEASEKPGMYKDPYEAQRAFLADETAGMTANGGPAPAQAEASDSDTLVRVSTGLHPGLAPEQERL